MIGLQPYLIVSAALFSLGMLGILTRRNAVNVLMGVELVLNSANLNLVAFSRFGSGNLQGQVEHGQVVGGGEKDVGQRDRQQQGVEFPLPEALQLA